MLDEGTLRERFPEIAWDQPVQLLVPKGLHTPEVLERWGCRYCIALYGLKAQDIIQSSSTFVFVRRRDCLDHIEAAHHE